MSPLQNYIMSGEVEVCETYKGRKENNKQGRGFKIRAYTRVVKNTGVKKN